ncbi:hypothetical protein N0B16_02165 [Chryseobacterium sp. GMJ5]|uniref:Lipoprotein n=1 Tax=Chryseobacterium gilvum TaxID=2976534 RepID=A0ABT2VTA0_9FLAO|nr:hypothetical protein [Chryseobacterium gilvum]MCU7613228.1 hypothetical protein [Chryseobacterium gilvum]
MDNKPIWRTILSVGLCLFAVVRLVMTCSKSSRNGSYTDTSYQDMNRLMEQSRGYQNESQHSDNDLFYKSYEDLALLTEPEKALNNVMKLDKDTLFPLDMTAKIKVIKNSYIQKSYDDTLKTAIKLPDNTSIFVHSYEGNGDLVDNFKSVKRKKEIKNLTFKLDHPDTKYVSYNYTDQGERYNGLALVTKENNHFTFIEFENNKISKDQLELKTLAFIAEIAK